MERRRLGPAGPDVPVVGMGTWRTFDVRGAQEAVAGRIVEEALDAGVRLMDTSPMYGEAERVLAGALGPRRGGAVVADKVWTSSPTEGEAQIRRALDWYGGRVECYQVHNLVAWRDHLPVLEGLRDAGAVDVVGATHYSPRAFDELARLMRTRRIGMVQVPYDPGSKEAEREILPLASELGLGVLVMTPLGGSRRLAAHPPPDAALAPLRPFGIRTWAQALLKWILSDPRVTAVIPATGTPGRMTENAAAGDPPWLGRGERDLVARLISER